MGVKNDPNSSSVFFDIFRATRKLEVLVSSTKSQQLCAFVFFYYFIPFRKWCFFVVYNKLQIRMLACAAAGLLMRYS